MDISIPFQYEPRPYQVGLFVAREKGMKRLMQCWHRRSGKDKTDINLMAREMMQVVAPYFYVFPTYAQGKKILWDGMDKDGMRFMDHLPQELRKRTDNTSMFVELKNGSTFQIIGSDNIDSIVGTNPRGVIFSEFSLQDPKAWDFIRPILAENGGWALFNFTSRGKNHAYDLYEYAKTDPSWFVSLLTVDDTGAIPKDVLEQERKEIIAKNGDDSIFQQEYYCSFEASVQGSYYGTVLASAKERIGNVPHDPSVKVDTWWDLGVGDAMAIWFTQNVGQEVHCIAYLESEGEGIPYYVSELQRFAAERGYNYGTHHWPHDGEARELTTGVSRKETAQKLGLSPISIVADIGVIDGIQAVRLLFPRVWIDAVNCKRGIDALKNYHKVYDEKRKEYKNTPEHDWSSHGADAFRYLAVGQGQYKTTRATRVSQTKPNHRPYSSRLSMARPR